MTTAYPGALDTFANPLAGDTLASPSHAAQHANANDLIELLMGDVFNVRAYDAPGDGTVQTEAIQAAIDAAGATVDANHRGGTVWFPAGAS